MRSLVLILGLCVPCAAAAMPDAPDEEIHVLDPRAYGIISRNWNDLLDQFTHQSHAGSTVIKLDEHLQIGILGSTQQLTAAEVSQDPDKLLREPGTPADAGHWVRFTVEGRIAAPFGDPTTIGSHTVQLGAAPYVSRRWTFEVRTGDQGATDNLAEAVWHGLKTVPRGTKYIVNFPGSATSAARHLKPGESLRLEDRIGATLSRWDSVPTGSVALSGFAYAVIHGEVRRFLKREFGGAHMRLRTVNNRPEKFDRGWGFNVGRSVQLFQRDWTAGRIDFNIFSYSRDIVYSSPVVHDFTFDLSDPLAARALDRAIRDDWRLTEKYSDATDLDGIGRGVLRNAEFEQQSRRDMENFSIGFAGVGEAHWKRFQTGSTLRTTPALYVLRQKTESHTLANPGPDQVAQHDFAFDMKKGRTFWLLGDKKRTHVDASTFEKQPAPLLHFRIEKDDGNPARIFEYVRRIAGTDGSAETVTERLKEASTIRKRRRIALDLLFHEAALSRFWNAPETAIWSAFGRAADLPDPTVWANPEIRRTRAKEARQCFRHPAHGPGTQAPDLADEYLLLAKTESLLRLRSRILADEGPDTDERRVRALRDGFYAFGQNPLPAIALALLGMPETSGVPGGVELIFTYSGRSDHKQDVGGEIRLAGGDLADRSRPIFWTRE